MSIVISGSKSKFLQCNITNFNMGAVRGEARIFSRGVQPLTTGEAEPRMQEQSSTRTDVRAFCSFIWIL